MAVITQGAAQTRADQITNETGANLNTATRVGSLFRDIVDSLKWGAFVASGLSAAMGLVPAPPTTTGTTKFLCEDATWKVPSGAFTAPVNGTDDGKIGYAAAGANAWAANIKTDGSYFGYGAAFGSGSSGLHRIPNASKFLEGKLFGGSFVDLIQLLGSDRYQVGATGLPFIEQKAIQQQVTLSAQASTALTPGLCIKPGAHTSITASAEVTDVLFDLNRTVQWSTGALATQRFIRIGAPTLSFVGASTATLAATLAITGAPNAGTNATITRPIALWIESGALTFGSSASITGTLNLPHGLSHGISGLSQDGTTDVDLFRWGNTSPNTLTLGGTAVCAKVESRIATGGAFDWFVNGTSITTLSATTLDLKQLTLSNVKELHGIVFDNEVNDGNSGTVKNLDFTTGSSCRRVTLTGNCTFSFTAPTQHKWIQLHFVQDATGGRTFSLPGNWIWDNDTPPPISTNANSHVIFTAYYDGTNYRGGRSHASAA